MAGIMSRAVAELKDDVQQFLLVGETPNVDRLARHHRMIRCSDHDELVLAPRHHLDTRMLDGSLDESDVGAKLEERAEDRPRVRAGGPYPHVRMPSVEAAEIRRQQVRRDGGARRHSENAALEAAQLAQLALGRALDAEQLAGARVERAPGLGERDGFPGSIEQRHVELPLELIQRFRDGGLAEPKNLGGLGEAPVLDDGREDPDVVEIKAHNLIS